MKNDNREVVPEESSTREQWCLANQLSCAIMNMNSVFCDGGPAEGPNKEYTKVISQLIAKNTTVFSLEDIIPILEDALDISIREKSAWKALRGN